MQRLNRLEHLEHSVLVHGTPSRLTGIGSPRAFRPLAMRSLCTYAPSARHFPRVGGEQIAHGDPVTMSSCRHLRRAGIELNLVSPTCL
jgi:hypothetical protein